MGQVDFVAQIAKAEARAGAGLKQLAQTPADQPIEAPAKAVADRKSFLTARLGSPELADIVGERVIAGNELQPINYLERGAAAARAT